MQRYSKDFRWIQSRTDLILYAQTNCESNACKRAFTTGTVVVLGGFSTIPPSTNPGWVLLVTSKHCRTWIIGVEGDDARHCYHVRSLDRIPWEKWVGGSSLTFRGKPLYWLSAGDKPRVAAAAHRGALREINERRE